MQSIFKISMQGSLAEDFNRIATRFSHKVLHDIMPGHLEDFTRTSHKSHLMREFTGIMPGPMIQKKLRPGFSASLHSAVKPKFTGKMLGAENVS